MRFCYCNHHIARSFWLPTSNISSAFDRSFCPIGMLCLAEINVLARTQSVNKNWKLEIATGRAAKILIKNVVETMQTAITIRELKVIFSMNMFSRMLNIHFSEQSLGHRKIFKFSTARLLPYHYCGNILWT